MKQTLVGPKPAPVFEEMATWRIFWGLYKRHETFLLYVALVVTLTYKLVRSGL